MEKEIVTALIAAGTSLGTVIIFKPIVDRYLHKFQLKQNYIADQSKKIKDVLAINKAGLLKSGELLNNRLKNFAKNYDHNWLACSGNYSVDRHYMDTMVYRFLAFYGYIKIIERNLIYLDTTISQESDLRLLKYFRLFHEVMCDVDLFEGFKYDNNYQTDHFFTTPFDNMVNHLIVDKNVIDLDDFVAKKMETMPKIISVYQFFDSINPHENRLRCERLKSMHLILIAFLNEFGYDYQRTNKKQLAYLKSRLGDYKLLANLKNLAGKYKLNKFCGDFEKVLSQMK
jgi:hypothetical protein